MEQRKIQFQGEFRAVGDGNTIEGTIPTGSHTDLGGYFEVIEPGAFLKSLLSNRTIFAFDQHNPEKPLANTKAGTLALEERKEGLKVRMRLDPEISYHKDLLLSVKRGNLGGMSFGFSVPPGGESWSGNLRTIHDMTLYEVSPVSLPAYEQSTISVRQQSNSSDRNSTMNNSTLATKQNGLYHDERGRLLYTLENLREMEANYESQQRSGGAPDFYGSLDFGRAEVVDQPIYRGPLALGQQMLDIINMTRPGAVTPEARDRHDRMVKRERALAEKRAAGTGGMVTAVGQDGGLLLQGETAMDLITSGFGNSATLSRSANRDLGTAQFVELVGVDETSRADGSRGGGVRVYSDKELELMLQSKPKFDKIRLEPKRLTGMYYASNEILDNAPILQDEMAALFGEEFGFKGQDLSINGSGAGEAMGVLKSPCLVTVAAENAQAAATINFTNLVKMKARVRVRNRNSLVWLANQDVEAQLFQLALPVGTGGSVMPVYVPSANQTDGVAGMLLGVPIIFVEQCATLGTVGDIILGDWSAYLSATKGGIQSASSIHLKFDYNQTAFRFVTYFDGQPRLKSAITPYKGSNTVSPFVALATR